MRAVLTHVNCAADCPHLGEIGSLQAYTVVDHEVISESERNELPGVVRQVLAQVGPTGS